MQKFQAVFPLFPSPSFPLWRCHGLQMRPHSGVHISVLKKGLDFNCAVLVGLMERGGKEGGLGSMELLGSGDLLVLEKGEGMEGEEVGVGESEGEGEGYLLCKSLFSPLSCSSAATQMMLCFGDGCQEEEAAVMTNGVPRKPSDSSLSTICSSPPSTNTTCSSSMASRKLEIGGGRRGRRATAAATTGVVTSKKTKTEVSARAGTIKVRKEKLGDRISALQQLVSPFGKSDTASVLQEAVGYIRFLQDQVQILSSPYLQRLPSSAHLHEGEGGPRRNDLRSRGLCLFPVSCMEHMANSRSNGADLWAPAIGSGNQPFDPEH